MIINIRNVISFVLMAFGVISSMAQGNVLSIPDVTGKAGGEFLLPVYLDNIEDIVGVEFNLSLPEGLSASDEIILSDTRVPDHVSEFRKIDHSTYKAIIYSLSNTPFSGRSGELMAIPIKVSSSLPDGSIFQLDISDVILANPDGDNVMSECNGGSFVVAMSADMIVTDVNMSVASVFPMQDLAVSWSVSNIGGISTEAGFRERIFLLDDNGVEKYIGLAECNVSLAPGESVGRGVSLKLPQTLGIDGKCRVLVKVVPLPDNSEPVWLQGNNSSVSSAYVDVAKRLFIDSASGKVSEASDSALSITLLRSGSSSQEESFYIVSTEEDSRFVIPETVVIPKGSQGVNFQIKLIPNGEVDVKDRLDLKIGNEAYGEELIAFDIEDDKVPVITLDADKDDLEEGDTVRFTLKTDKAPKSDIKISLECDNPTRLSFPSDVILLAGESTVSFQVSVLSNNIPDGDAEIMVAAKAPGYDSDPLFLSIIDDDMPTISLAFSSTGVAENEGRHSLTGVISRLDNIDKKIVVRLIDDMPGQLVYSSSSLIMHEGEESVEFTFGPVDNELTDGNREVNVVAGVYLMGCSCTPPLSSKTGISSKSVMIIDDDSPMLTLSGPSAIAEGGKGEFTLSRNSDIDKSLEVELLADDGSSVVIPLVVTIPQNSSKTTFMVEGSVNSEVGDDQRIMLTAKADGYGSGFASVTLTDRSLPDARIVGVKGIEDAIVSVASGDYLNLSVTIANEGTSDLPELTRLGLYIEGREEVIAEQWTQTRILAADSLVVEVPFKVPDLVGMTFLKLIVNDSRTVKELDYTNNIRSIPVSVSSPYSVKLSTDKPMYGAEEKIQIKGNIVGNFTAGDSIKVYISNSISYYSQMADIKSDGSFMACFEPYKGLIGTFRIGACHPTVKNSDISNSELQIDILGIKNANKEPYITYDTHPGDKNSGIIEVFNPCSVDIKGIRVDIAAIDGIEFTVGEYPDIIASGESLKIPYTFIFNRISSGYEWEVLDLRVGAENLTPIYMPLYLFSRSKEALLQTDVNVLETSVVKGSSRTYPIVIVNNGGGEAKDVSFSVPSWMSVTPSSIPSIPSGESVTVLLTAAPKWNPGESNHTGKMFINCKSAQSVSIPFDVEVVSSSNGILEVEVCDNNTYLLPNAPKVPDALISLSNASTGVVAFTGKTDDNGVWKMEVPEGIYNLQVSASGHDSNNWYITVDPCRTNHKVANITISSGVNYHFTAEEIELEDEYSISVSGVYETNVPRPDIVITAIDEMKNEDILPGDGRIIRFLVKNVGLIRAEELEFQLPASGDDWTFEKIFETPMSSLEAGQSVVVPVLITRGNSSIPMSMAKAPSTVLERCMENFIEHYKFNCGTDMIDNHAVYRYAMKICASAQIYSALAGASAGGGCSGTTRGNGKKQEDDPDPVIIHPPVTPPSPTYPALTTYDEWLLSMFDKSFCNPDIASRAEAISGVALGFVYPVAGMADNVASVSVDWNAWQNGHNDYKKDFFFDLGSLGIGITGAFANTFTNLRGVNYITALCDALLKAIGLGTRSNDDDSVPSWIREFDDETLTIVEELHTLENLMKEYFGDDVWIRPYDSENSKFFNLFSDRSLYNEEGMISYESLKDSKPSYISENQLHRFIDRLNNTFTGADSDNRIDMMKLGEYAMEVKKFEDVSIEMGYNDSYSRFNEASASYKDMLEMESNSVCASVTLQFKQSLAMTRQALRGLLTVSNGHESKSISNFRFAPSASDKDGKVADDSQFAIAIESLSGFEGQSILGSSWSLDAKSEGTSTVLFIPTQNAAPDEDTIWGFGGNISYIDPFTEAPVSVNLSPVFLTVRPTPLLNMDYFLQRDVIGDDPMTDVIETSCPAEFSLIISNVGKGTAKNVGFVTYPPQVEANVKGLDINFNLVSSALNGHHATLSAGSEIRNEIGDILPGEGAVAQWWFMSSLLGHFIDYKAEYTHVSNYDNPSLSLIKDINVHELIHSVRDTEGNVAFLVNDIPDKMDSPESIYFQDGTTDDVISNDAYIEKISDTEWILHVNSDGGKWTYGKIKDPSYGMQTILSVRSLNDGQDLPISNFWQTDRTLIDGRDPVYENMLHFAVYAYHESSSYSIMLTERCEDNLEVVKIMGLPDNGISENDVKDVIIQFNRPVDSKTFTAEDIQLSRNGQEISCSDCLILQVSDTEFSVDLSDFVFEPGDYKLVVFTSNISGFDNVKGKYDGIASWTELGNNLINITIKVSPENAGIVSPVKVSGKYGDKVTFFVSPSTGFKFFGWTEDEKIISEKDTLEIRLYESRSLVASFLPIKLKVEVDGGDGGIVSQSDAIVEYGSRFSVTAIPDENFEFDCWIVNGSELENHDCVLDIDVKEDTHVFARFKRVFATQKIKLSTGWNWISTYLQDVETSGLTGKILAKENPKEENKFDFGSMYKVKSAYNQIFEAKGKLSTHNPIIEVKEGSNWIGFLSDTPMSLDEAFIHGPADGDFICGQRGFSEFCNDKWVGSLDVLIPGEGYIYHVSNNDKTLTYSENIIEDNSLETRHPSSFIFSEAMYLSILIVDNKSESGMYDIEVECGNESRGYDLVVDGIHMITLFGQKGDIMTLNVKDKQKSNVIVMSLSMQFEEGIIGSRGNPLIIDVNDEYSVNSLIEAAEKISVYQLDGNLILHNADPKQLLSITPGIYIVNGKCLYIK